jgi:hypothetical protein
MKKKYPVHSIAFAICVLGALAFPQQIPTVAVLDFTGKGVSAEEASVLTDKLRGELMNSGRVQLIERGAMDEILKEQGFQQSGCTSNECIVEAGQLMGVQYMAAGSIGKIEKTFLLSVRFINVQTSKIEKNVQREITGTLTDVLKTAIAEVAKELTSQEIRGGRKDESLVQNTPAREKPARTEKPDAAGGAPQWRRRISLAFCKGLGSMEYSDDANQWYDDALLSPSGVQLSAGLRARYQYIGVEVIFARSADQTLINSRHVFHRTVAGINAVWYFERLTLGRAVTLAPGCGLGYTALIDHGGYSGEVESKTTDLVYARFASPRLKLHAGIRRYFFTLEYLLLLGIDSNEGTVTWVHADGSADYQEGSHAINLTSLLCAGIGIRF